MDPVNEVKGIAAFLDRNNVDTDAILPKQFMKSIKRSGYGPFLFDEWRYLDKGELGIDCSTRPLNPEFELNQPQAAGASILITRNNFGCGSSREHAPWALKEYGFSAIVAESFAEIFRSNCLKNGLLPITLPKQYLDELFSRALSRTAVRIVLKSQTLSADGLEFSFWFDPIEKKKLLLGLDDIALTLQHAEQIRAFEAHRFELLPWLQDPPVR
ncbi:3-isopropylmalate dehydratase small subunit [Pseudomonas sp. D8002]|uniref:3-isopropylmalate dehydratase small subunit n=1 Tax=unclassified Pseudomonas TaxID=196821 RepID=UPI0015A155F7|nr:3-isopropylmalate dehydratase small subunit [Pseudomonas sp. D8002]NWB20982.1 3-isopropylmalate dehydratase small subunit [Pseudomonas sp. D4002]